MKSRVKLRPFGINTNIDVVGRAKLTMTTIRGNTTHQCVYAVRRHKVEPLVVSEKKIGILKIHPKGEVYQIEEVEDFTEQYQNL